VPPLPYANEVLEVQLRHTYAADLDVLTRVFFAYTGTAPVDSGLNTMASTVSSAWGTNLKSLAVPAVALTEVVVTDLTSATSARGVWSGSVAGTRSGTDIFANVCMNVGFVIARRYRGGKPKCYLPFGNASDLQTSQTWTSTFVSAVGTGWAAFITAVIAAAPSGTTISGQINVSYFQGFTSVENPITHRYRNVPTLRATPVQDTVIGTVYQTRPASQRRRLGKAA
jgi:hypothetical protein